MKKIFTLLLVLLSVTMGMAQRPARVAKPLGKQTIQKLELRTPKAKPTVAPTVKAGDLVTVPATATTTVYTPTGDWYGYASSGWVSVSAPISVNVAFDGNDVYIQGLAYYFPDAYIKGTMTTDGRVVFPSGQYVGTDDYGDEYLVGSDANDETSATITDIVFNYDAETGVLTLSEDVVILETAGAEDTDAYMFWETLTLTPGGVEVVTPPANATVEDWVLIALTPDQNSESESETDDEEGFIEMSAPAKVIFDGNDVYIQGFSSYLTEAWVKGTREGNTVTSPTGQYLGAYNYWGTDYPMYFLGADPYAETIEPKDVVFEMSEEGNIMEAAEGIFVSDAADSFNYYDYYLFAMLQKAVEGAATPATPEVLDFTSDEYGHYTEVSLPLVDVSGQALKAANLSYQFYYEVNGAAQPFVLRADKYEQLDEDMETIPYGFTDNWDIYVGPPTTVYIYDDNIASWTRFGVKSIYTAGGETRESEIGWFDLDGNGEVVEGDAVTFDFNALDTETFPYSASGSTEGDITEDYVMEEGPITLTVSPSGGNTPNRFWLFNTTQAIQLRVYGGTLTFESEENRPIAQIVFENGKWNEENTADSGSFSGTSPATWTGKATKVVVSIAGNTQINKIVVTTAENTGIQTVSTARTAEVFNLQGQRVLAPAQHGVYIIGGKKVVK
ncbi:MAG: hypothetical protein IJ659_08500 [Alloprevotella sp.]|nr:hypothetical protein [Alloprevotella sp.]